LTFGGGCEKFLIDISSALVRKGHDVYLITFDERLYRIANLFVVRPTQRRLDRQQIFSRLGKASWVELSTGCLFPSSRAFRKTRQLLRSCDVVYVKNEIFDMLILKLLAGRLRTTVCGIHTAIWYPSQPSLRSKLHKIVYLSYAYSWLLRHCTAVHVPNIRYLELTSSELGVDRLRLFWIPIGIDPHASTSQDKTVTDKFTILYIGRLTEQKGIDLLCKAVDILSETPEFSKMSFEVGGSGELEHLILDLCRRHRNVKYFGYIKDDKMDEVYGSADIAVSPSRWESMPYGCLEPQAHGIPVVASNILGPKEIVVDGKTGVLFHPGDAKALAEAMLYLFHLKESNPLKFYEMRRFSMENALAKFSVDLVIEKMEQMFSRVLK
jgi:glycosyltransferase involved in cell wall biosynthesis